MMINRILLSIVLCWSLVECGVRTQIRQNVRELGRLLSFQRTDSFNVASSTRHHIPDNHIDITDHIDLLNVRYVLVKNIHASLLPNSTINQDNININRKLFKHYNNKYAEDFDEKVLRDMAQQHEFRMETLKHGQLQFISLAPKLFADIRRQKGINDEDYLESLAGSMTMLGPLRSQAFFFYTSDQQYMIKFMRTTDGTVFSQTFPDYYRTVLLANSLLTHIIGSYRIQYSHKDSRRRDVYNVIVIKNSFPLSADLKPEIVFDLKGSTHNAFNHRDEIVPALKDCPFLESRIKLYLGNMRKSLFTQMAADTEYLERAQINDFSLLLGIRHVDYSLVKFSLHRFTHWVRTDKNGLWYSFNGGFIARNNDGTVYRAPNGKVPVYYMSIIDLFTVWSRDRQEERQRKIISDSVSSAE